MLLEDVHLLTFGFREEERNYYKVHSIQANEYNVVLPADVGDSEVGHL